MQIKWILFVSLLLLTAEILFRYIGPQGQFTALSSRWQEPYLHFGDFKSIESRETPKDYGYREKLFAYTYEGATDNSVERGDYLSPSRNISSGKLIYLIGGSAALGDGASVRLSERLTKLLQPDYNVIVKAARAYQSTQERIIFDLYLQNPQPEVFVFFDGFNDLNQLESATRPGDPHNMGVIYSIHENLIFRWLYAIAGVSKIASYLTQRNYENIISQSANTIFKDPEKLNLYNRSVVDIYWQNIQHINSVCLAKNFKCLFVLQPALGSDSKPGSKYFWSVYPELIQRKPENLKDVVLNLVDKYKPRDDLFVDVVHMNDQGQALVAQDLVKLIKKSFN